MLGQCQMQLRLRQRVAIGSQGKARVLCGVKDSERMNASRVCVEVLVVSSPKGDQEQYYCTRRFLAELALCQMLAGLRRMYPHLSRSSFSLEGSGAIIQTIFHRIFDNCNCCD